MSNGTAVSAELAQRVHDMLAQYVNRKTESRCGIKWDDFKNKKIIDPESGRERIDIPREYRETRQKVCEEAFLAMRSRKTREDFVTYFVGTVCAFPQYLPDSDYHRLAAGLLTDGEQWLEIKALAMLTVSSLMGL